MDLLGEEDWTSRRSRSLRVEEPLTVAEKGRCYPVVLLFTASSPAPLEVCLW